MMLRIEKSRKAKKLFSKKKERMHTEFREKERNEDTISRKRARLQMVYRDHEKKTRNFIKVPKRKHSKPSDVLGWINNSIRKFRRDHCMYEEAVISCCINTV